MFPNFPSTFRILLPNYECDFKRFDRVEKIMLISSITHKFYHIDIRSGYDFFFW